MEPNEIVRQLREKADAYRVLTRRDRDSVFGVAADCIERLQAENESLAINGGKYIEISQKRYEMYEAAIKRAEDAECKLSESQRRERAALSDMKVMALAMRESEELSEGCCFACAYEAQNLPDGAMLPYGECPGYDTDECFEWRGPEREGEANHE